jgi:DNA-directed RNA polymerase subunit L
MELKPIQKTKYKVVLEVDGETHTLLNIIKDELWNDSDVKITGYNIDHPLTGKPKLTIQTSSEDAISVLQEALKRAKSQYAKLRKSLE